MKKILSLFVLLSLQGYAFAQLPVLSPKDLVEKIRSEEEKIWAFNIKHQQSTGKYEETESGSSGMIPEVIIDLEYARDIEKGYKYLHERWVTLVKEQEYERKYAYDGKMGTRLVLKLPDDQERMYGYITNSEPDLLSEDGGLGKPDFFTYGFFETDKNLSTIIADDNDSDVTSEELNDQQVYKVTFSVPGEVREFTMPQTGETVEIKTKRYYIAWLLPENGFNPVRLARLNGPDGQEISVYLASDFREVEDGIWFPYRLERPPREVGTQRGRIIEIKSIDLNESAVVVSRLKFPEGTRVEDETSGLEYMASDEE